MKCVGLALVLCIQLSIAGRGGYGRNAAGGQGNPDAGREAIPRNRYPQPQQQTVRLEVAL